jgi:hypothetical protein
MGRLDRVKKVAFLIGGGLSKPYIKYIQIRTKLCNSFVVVIFRLLEK